MKKKKKSYHDVEVEFNNQRFRLSDASYGLSLTCSRTGGWELWKHSGEKEELIAGEYHFPKLTVYVSGNVICDKKKRKR